MLLVIAIFVFLATLVIILISYNLLAAEKRAVSNRLARYVRKPDLPAKMAVASEVEISRSGSVSLLIKGISQYVEAPQLAKWFEHHLIQAGLPMRGSEFIVICLGAALLTGALLLILTGKAFAGILGISLGFVLPVLVLKVKITQRSRAFNGQLGDSLVLIANSLRTGYSFMQAIEVVAREMPTPIADEFGRALKEMSLGITTEDAMNNLAKRVDSDDLDLVITAVLIQRQVGGNLAEVLDNIASTIRERVKLKGKIRTLTAQGRISGIIISLLPICVGMLIYIINPEYVKVLFSHPIGKMLLAVGVASQVFGIIIIRKIVNIEV